jgi:hypothetical protein
LRAATRTRISSDTLAHDTRDEGQDEIIWTESLNKLEHASGCFMTMLVGNRVRGFDDFA